MNQKKAALFGGTFDPIHLGHTTVAASAAESIGAQKIVFVPAKRSPLKVIFPQAGDEDRLAMISLVISGKNGFEVSDYELKKSGPNYTLETVRYFKNRFGDDTLIYWLIGADALDDLPHWYGIIELIDECNLAVMCRGGIKKPDFSKYESLWGRKRVEKLQKNIIQTPLIDISSTNIRKCLAAGEDVKKMVCPSVLQYIREHALYGAMSD